MTKQDTGSGALGEDDRETGRRLALPCEDYVAGRCRSCTELEVPYAAQLRQKDARCREILSATDPGTTAKTAATPGANWLPCVPSAVGGFRTKAKMVVTGSSEAPIFGLLAPANAGTTGRDSVGQADAGRTAGGDGAGVDLTGCPLYPAVIRGAFPALQRFVSRASIAPYDVARRRGELKYVIVTSVPPANDLGVRFVLRSTESLVRIRKHLSWLLAALPHAVVVSVNLQPEHSAIVEGDEEIVLTGRRFLTVEMNGREACVAPRAFLQTNAGVAAALYRQVRDWIEDGARFLAATAGDARSDGATRGLSIWDLYCGVGMFGWQCWEPGRRILGVESNLDSVEAAQETLRGWGDPGRGGLSAIPDTELLFADAPVPEARCDLRIVASDALEFVRTTAEPPPDVVIVNPPRRGLGADLCRWLDESAIPLVIYSSCHPPSMARDLSRMPSLVLHEARTFDMFPHTEHCEVAGLLRRR